MILPGNDECPMENPSTIERDYLMLIVSSFNSTLRYKKAFYIDVLIGGSQKVGLF